MDRGAARVRNALAILAIAAGVLAALAERRPSPHRIESVPLTQLARTIEAEEDHITATELAEWIRGRKRGLRVLDLRTTAEYETYRIPTSTNITLPSLVETRYAPDDTLVLISDGGAHAAQAWVLMRARGYANVHFLRGGMQEWIDSIAEPEKPTELSRYFGGTRRNGC
jgi:rhodanese-related sulfurtransferase